MIGTTENTTPHKPLWPGFRERWFSSREADWRGGEFAGCTEALVPRIEDGNCPTFSPSAALRKGVRIYAKAGRTPMHTSTISKT
jgi:hypothetical protein